MTPETLTEYNDRVGLSPKHIVFLDILQSHHEDLEDWFRWVEKEGEIPVAINKLDELLGRAIEE